MVLSLPRAWVQALVRELKFHKPLSRAKKKKKKNSELISAVNLLPQACYSLVSGHLHALHTVVLCLIPSEPGLLSSMEIEPFLEP